MAKYFFLLFFLLFGFAANAQPADALVSFNLWQAEVLKAGMGALAAWALLNIIIGSFKLTKASRSKRYFYQMNIYWNIVNILIAGTFLYFLLTEDVTNTTLAESLRQHLWYKKVLYANVGLDVSYIILGAYLKERSRNIAKTEQYLGWGESLVLQGVVLFILDLVLTVLLELPSESLLSLIQA
ncbi:DUF6992 family protein [Pontibacter harenae]|uniref:DUF6992 family protein n=1 Tax=Pontibacter harenae TaxID=2894083 RepID=UPI001E650DEA|nr:hypothetical protein [Pontibacter harenae]MCC9166463.1 hypothetical protein [Pontibacter harenae]